MSSTVKMLPGEDLAFELECDLIRVGTNPLMVKIAQLGASLAKLLGTSTRVKLVVTNKRVIQISSSVACWCIPQASVYQVIIPHSVKEVGYYHEAMCFGMMKSFFLYYEGLTEKNVFVMKGVTEDQMSDYVAKFYSALNAQKP
jgi:hypothetical protein